MIGVETYVLFIAASAALAVAPGPDNLFVITQSALFGRRAGVFVTFGLATGLVVHTAAVALGVAAVFQSSALAFTALKVVGAGYLLYLAWGAFRASASGPAMQKTQPALRGAALYRRGVIMNITNPKVAIFMLAFLPQFADPQRGPLALQLAVLGGVMIVVTIVVFSAFAIGGGSLGSWLRQNDRAQVWLNRLAGLVFVALAVRLLATTR